MANHNNKKYYRILIIVSTALLLYICYIKIGRNEINNVHFIQMFCIDKGADDFQVSALYSDAGSNQSNTLEFLSGNGATVYNAFEDLKRKDAKELTITHTSYYLISTSAAQYGLEECLDFISRDESVKTNASVYIMKAENANKVLNNAIKDEFLPQEMLDSITQKQIHTLKKTDNTLMYVLNNMNSPYNSLLIPTLTYTDKNIYVDGYAAFKSAKLYKFLDYSTAQAIDLFRNRLRTCPLVLNQNITVELTDLKVNQVIHFSNNKLNLTYELKTDAEMKEIATQENVFNDSDLSEIKKLENKSLNSMLSNIISLMQKDKLDLLDIGGFLSNNTKNSEADAQKWEDYLANLNYSLNIDSTIAKNYIITK